MSNLAELQSKFDEISAIRQAAKGDFSIPNARRREIDIEYKAAWNELLAATKAAKAAAAECVDSNAQQRRSAINHPGQEGSTHSHEETPAAAPLDGDNKQVQTEGSTDGTGRVDGANKD